MSSLAQECTNSGACVVVWRPVPGCPCHLTGKAGVHNRYRGCAGPFDSSVHSRDRPYPEGICVLSGRCGRGAVRIRTEKRGRSDDAGLYTPVPVSLVTDRLCCHSFSQICLLCTCIHLLKRCEMFLFYAN